MSEEETRRIKDNKNRDKRAEAEERQGRRGIKSAQEQLEVLDKRLGKGVGAFKERAKLNRILEKK